MFDTQMLLIRHGQSLANVGLSNEPDCALTDFGAEQARVLGRRLAQMDLRGFDAFVSPYRRARQTAEAISLTTGIAFSVEPAIREWGAVATIDEVEYPQEPLEPLVARLRVFVERHRRRRLMIVSHAAPIAVMTQLLWREPLHFPDHFWMGVGNACLRWICSDEGSA